ncbi:MAG TPA: bifunctional diguanylate cyclase/phosphodiesterase [Nitrospiria bacterium]
MKFNSPNKDKRGTIIWLRWLLIIALSYLMLFHSGRLVLSWEISSITLLYFISNVMLMFIPLRFFEKKMFDMILVIGDSLIITGAMFIAGFSSTNLVLFYFLIILLTTLGKGGNSVVINGLIMVGVYLVLLLQTEPGNIIEKSGLLLQIPFLILCTVFYAVLADRESKKRNQILDRVKADEAMQTVLRSEIESKEIALNKAEELSQAMRHQAMHDSLTALPNRSLIIDRLKKAIPLAMRENKRLALIMMDLDRFKEVNDTLGHHVGDLVLQHLATRLNEVLRGADTIARLGGDEFGVLLYPVRDHSAASMVAHRILNVGEKAIVIGEHRLTVGASLGVVVFPEDGKDVETLMRLADVAMYRAKRTKSGFAFYDPDQDQRSLDRLKLMGELRKAIESEQLMLYYQPKVDFSTNRIRGVEALVRWPHGREETKFPDIFIPLAEQTGLIKPLTSWVINAALRQFKLWQQEGFELNMAVNISASSLHDPQFPEWIDEKLKAYNVKAESLELEITESAIMLNPSRAVEIVKKLNGMGVSISIDDFGTGYSSLAYLKELSVTSIKIDKSFITNILTNPSDSVIVRSTIDLGHNLGLKVVAEGIESQDIWDQLAALGCDMGQGFLVCYPLPAEKIMFWLKESPFALGAGNKVIKKV